MQLPWNGLSGCTSFTFPRERERERERERVSQRQRDTETETETETNESKSARRLKKVSTIGITATCSKRTTERKKSWLLWCPVVRVLSRPVGHQLLSDLTAETSRGKVNRIIIRQVVGHEKIFHLHPIHRPSFLCWALPSQFPTSLP